VPSSSRLSGEICLKANGVLKQVQDDVAVVQDDVAVVQDDVAVVQDDVAVAQDDDLSVYNSIQKQFQHKNWEDLSVLKIDAFVGQEFFVEVMLDLGHICGDIDVF